MSNNPNTARYLMFVSVIACLERHMQGFTKVYPTGRSVAPE